MTNEKLLSDYRDDSKFPYLSEVVYTVEDVAQMLDAAREDEAVGFIKWLNNKIGLWSNNREWENVSLNQFYQLYLKHKNEKL